MILTPAKRNNRQVELMFVNINTASRRSALVDKRASDLFISKKVTGKIGILIIKLTKKIKMVNFKEVLIVVIAQKVELQISEWKSKEDFKVIHLDDYDIVLGLNFIDRIKTCSFPFVNCNHIFDDLQPRYVVLVNRGIRVEIEVLSTIQLVQDVSYREEHRLSRIERHKNLLKNARGATNKYEASRVINGATP
ncbi:hypothetical protein J1N35_019247 [Gossypium stocksii]|uniref:Uncharacterized protein n=1 Tax=Gossypium stocksii TaxID=47602 RepID=A0A9D4A7Y3_9ROSI|nr:hypothetical protein J1N35_019247 [Gossypium stocksii]